MIIFQSLTRRAALLVVTGASIIYLLFTAAYYATSPDALTEAIDNASSQRNDTVSIASPFYSPSSLPMPPTPISIDIGLLEEIPETSIVAHAPGWTLFKNLYMANGTLYIVSSEPRKSNFPQIRMMISTGLLAENNPQNIAMREPTDQEMQIISQQDAALKWGGDVAKNERNRIWTIEGNTVRLFDGVTQSLN